MQKLKTLPEIYLDGACLAQQWLRNAELRGAQGSVVIYRRLLSDAIDNYERIKIEYDREQELIKDKLLNNCWATKEEKK